MTAEPILPGPDPSPGVDVDAAIARIRERVSRRRALGEYPEGMEDQLDRHYRELVANLVTEHTSVRRLHESVRQLDELPAFGRSRIEYSSRTPAGRLFHRVWGKLSSRQTEGVLAQMRIFSNAVTHVADRMAEVVETLALHGHPETERRLAGLADRMALLEEMARRLDRIEAEVASQRAAAMADPG